MKLYNYDTFLFEWGYGAEGGIASKDPIKVKSSMITNIDLDEDEDEKDEVDIPILQDNLIKEGVDELKKLFGETFAVKVNDSNELLQILQFFEKHDILWISDKKATELTEFYEFIFFNIPPYNKLTRSHEKFYDHITYYTIDQILGNFQNQIRWYKKGKLQKESQD